MNIYEALYGRRSVRNYSTEPLDDELIRRLIDAAIQAPSAVNEQPWTFTVVRNQALLERISHDAKAYMLENLPAVPQSERLRSMLGDAGFQIFHHAPALILVSGRAEEPWIVEDCTLAAENLMLAAHADGLGTCWIGFAQRYLDTPEGKAALGIPAQWKPVAPIIVGRPRSVPLPVSRKAAEVMWLD
ncbi:nitroreductase family protein [Pseudomonas knackmussii]|uniref:nitroreductase family protein n=1 Tax=Pseudomonas knackmussii TaxID=65741 RepID=UPI0013627ABA|nr:nitroreductase family protein [Pseudomonas knackmussii]